MFARERALHSLLELTRGSSSPTPAELADRVLELALALVDSDGAALTAPSHRERLRVLRARDGRVESPEANGLSAYVRQLWRSAEPRIVADLAAETSAGEDDRFPGIEPGPALFVPFGSRDTSPGCLTVYRAAGAAPFTAADARTLTLLATSVALALENRRLARDLQKLAVTDDLTQVYNYRYLKTALRRELKRAARFRQTLSVVMIDVDSLKAYNDVNGHLRGSFLLKELAQLCVEQVRSFDVLAKYGGDEFTIILPQTDIAGARIVAERVRSAVASHAFALVPKGRITVSLGVAAYPQDGADSVTLLRAADHALYTAKRKGRNRVEVVEEDLAA